MSEDEGGEFTTTGINRDFETVLEEETRVGRKGKIVKEPVNPPDSKTERDEQAKKAQEELDRGRTTLQKLADKGLSPKKNLDSIFLTAYTLLLSATVHRIENGKYEHLIYYILLTVGSLACLVLTEKGDMTTILRQIWLVTLTRIGARAEVKERKQAGNSIWGRLK